jgi:hypothetical protein
MEVLPHIGTHNMAREPWDFRFRLIGSSTEDRRVGCGGATSDGPVTTTAGPGAAGWEHRAAALPRCGAGVSLVVGGGSGPPRLGGRITMTRAPVCGRTRWPRFCGVLAAGLAGAAVMLVGMSRGAVAASFAVSGTSFKISADRLEGTGFVQFGGVDDAAGTPRPVAVSAFRTAVLDNFCQSASLRGLPVVGDVTLRMESPVPQGMSATDIVLGVEALAGDLTLVNPRVGVDAAHVSTGPPGVVGQPGGFGQQADKAVIVMPRQVAWSASAYTMRLTNLRLSLHTDSGECH